MGDRHLTGNFLVDSLPDEEAERLLAGGEEVAHERGTVLFERNQAIGAVYFPVTSVISLIIQLEDGAAVEMATVGREGMVGISRFLGSERAFSQGIVQIPGRALRIESGTFLEHEPELPRLRDVLSRYTRALISLMGQNAACNRSHRIEQRCARWLLLTQDRVDAEEIPLTQEFLAYMLGVRRQSVTEAAGRLQDRGLIRYRRGTISIRDRRGLMAAACECYGLVAAEFDRLLPIRGSRRTS
jgi:CRP-like cAMP-binding protein